MLETTVHFLSDVATVLLKLTEGVLLDAFNFLTLALQFVFKFLDQVSLLLLPLLSLILNALLNLTPIFGQICEYFTLFLHSCIFLGLEVGELSIHSFVDRVKLIVETLDSVVALAGEFVLEVLATAKASLVLVLLVLGLVVEVPCHLSMQILQLLIVLGLISLE